MTDPFPMNPIYDQMIREREEQQPQPSDDEWPAEDTPEEPSA